MSKRSVTPRRQPRTKAGEEIARAVLAAARDLLEKEGPKALSTNRIAERAGVSVGSLYQYYPNKDAIVAELAREVENDSLRFFSSLLEHHEHEPIAEPVSRVVRLLAGSQIGGHKFRRAIRELVPDGWTSEVSEQVDREARDVLSSYLQRRSDVRKGPHDTMAWIALHAIEGTIEAAVWHRPELLEDPEFLEELERLRTLELTFYHLLICFVDRFSRLPRDSAPPDVMRLYQENLALKVQVDALAAELTRSRGKKAHMSLRTRAAQVWAYLVTKGNQPLHKYNLSASHRTIRRWATLFRRGAWRRRQPENRGGGPPTPDEIVKLVLTLKRENPGWGQLKISQTPRALGISISAPTVQKILGDSGFGPLDGAFATWERYTSSAKDALWALDFFVVRALGSELLQVPIVIDVYTRELLELRAYRESEQVGHSGVVGPFPDGV